MFADVTLISSVHSIRYAAPPVGKLRWQAPRPPLHTSEQLTPAVSQPPLCPQSGAYGTPAVYGFNSGKGDEDCLYLNVYAAPDANNLPVMFWIRESLVLIALILHLHSRGGCRAQNSGFLT